jgi:hypothetical protein
MRDSFNIQIYCYTNLSAVRSVTLLLYRQVCVTIKYIKLRTSVWDTSKSRIMQEEKSHKSRIRDRATKRTVPDGFRIQNNGPKRQNISSIRIKV